MNNKLFVGNLSFDTADLALQDLFAAHGVVEDVNVVTDRVSGRPRGFAFVTMSKPEEAQAAISALNGTNLNGRDITVTEARPREERSGGGGGSHGYAGGGGGYRGGRGGGDRDRGPRRERY